jgi:transcriptional regulator with XRE-family HTH domain
MTSAIPLAYSFEKRLVGNQLVPYVIAKCSSCHEEGFFRWKGSNNPAHVATRFRKSGWDFDPYKASRNTCPTCNPHRVVEPAGQIHIALPANLKTVGERAGWLRAKTPNEMRRIDVADAAHVPERAYKAFEDGELRTYNDQYVVASKVIPVYRRHLPFPVSVRWLLGLPEEGSVLHLTFKHAMQSASITTGFLASQTGVPISVIEGILSGAMPNYYRIDELARHLRTSADALRCEASHVKADKPERAAKAEPAATVVAREGDLPNDLRGIIQRRLRSKRDGENISQGVLAERIVAKKLLDIGRDTLTTYLSKLERGNRVARECDILRACAAVFKVTPEWMLGEGDEPVEEPPDPVLSLPPWALNLSNPDDFTRQLASIRADHAALQDQHDILISDAASIRVLMDEMMGKVDVMEAFVAAMPRPVAEAVVKVIAEPVEAILQIAAPPPLAILTTPAEAAEAVLAEVLDGTPDLSPAALLNGAVAAAAARSSVIDRDAPTHQNTFAKLLKKGNRFYGRNLTVPTILSELKQTLSAMMPDVTKPRERVRRMMMRESAAPNGILVLISPGQWQIRDALAAD